MFTGIVTGLGRVTAHQPIGDGQRITVACGDWPLDDIAIGDSIMHSGCCLTIVEKARACCAPMLRRTPSAWLPGSGSGAGQP